MRIRIDLTIKMFRLDNSLVKTVSLDNRLSVLLTRKMTTSSLLLYIRKPSKSAAWASCVSTFIYIHQAKGITKQFLQIYNPETDQSISLFSCYYCWLLSIWYHLYLLMRSLWYFQCAIVIRDRPYFYHIYDLPFEEPSPFSFTGHCSQACFLSEIISAISSYTLLPEELQNALPKRSYFLLYALYTKLLRALLNSVRQTMSCPKLGLSSSDSAQQQAITVKSSSGQLSGWAIRWPFFKKDNISKASMLA